MPGETKKSILIFSTAYLPLVGGAEVAVKEITDRLMEFEFTLVTARLRPDLPAREKIGNVEVYRIGAGAPLDKLRLAWRGARKARTLGSFDMVWSIMASFGGLAGARYKSSRPNVPFFLTLQEGAGEWNKWTWRWPFVLYFRKIFASADAVQPISNYLAEWAGKMGVGNGRITVVPNAIDVKKFIISDPALYPQYRAEVRQQLSMAPDSKIVITASRLVKKNDVADLISAISFLPEDVHLLVAGEGELRGWLEEEVKNLNISGRVHFLGEVSQKQLPKYLWASDVFSRPSLTEGLGIAFLEAMAAGLPIVATPVGGIMDFLGDQQVGLLCRVHDPKDLAEKIRTIITGGNLESYHSRNSARARDNYNWDKIAAMIGSMMGELIYEHRAPERGHLSVPSVLIAADIFPPESGGPATYAVTLAKGLSEQGIKVKIVSLTPGSDPTKAPPGTLFAVTAKNKIGRYAQYFRLLFKQARSADVVYAMGPVNAGLPAWLAARLSGKKFVVKVVGDYAWEQGVLRFGVTDGVDEFQKHQEKYRWPVQLLVAIERFVARRADKIIVPSKYLKGMVNGWRVPEDRIDVIYNSIEFGQEVPAAAKPVVEKWIVSVGRLVPWKGMAALIEIMPEILKAIPSAKLKIIGDGPEMACLKSKIEQLNLVAAVELPGNLSREKTLSYIKSADVFVLNSGYEGLSHVLLETAKLGVPILASRAGGNPEIVSDESLFIFNDAKQIESKVATVLAREAESTSRPAEIMSTEGNAVSVEEFSAAAMINRTDNVLKSLCK